MRAGTTPDLTGQLLDGRYRVGDKVARGGMATVYEALDTRLDRTVAVKVMHPGMGDDDEFARRFVQEARSAARLSHPNVVAVYDQGSDDGVPYLAMEYCPGMTLREVIRNEAPLAPARALDLLLPVLAALGAAHDAGLVHRDVKPENVLITRTGDVKVADFGLARAITANGNASTKGVLMGTVSYLAPELVSDDTADTRSDVYSAGIVLYELLTGRKPHKGDSPIQVAYRHVHNNVPRPSAAIRSIPPYVDALVQRATARDRDLRPRDAHVFSHQVRRVRSALAEGLPDDPDLTEDLTLPSTMALGETDRADVLADDDQLVERDAERNAEHDADGNDLDPLRADDDVDLGIPFDERERIPEVPEMPEMPEVAAGSGEPGGLVLFVGGGSAPATRPAARPGSREHGRTGERSHERGGGRVPERDTRVERVSRSGTRPRPGDRRPDPRAPRGRAPRDRTPERHHAHDRERDRDRDRDRSEPLERREAAGPATRRVAAGPASSQPLPRRRWPGVLVVLVLLVAVGGGGFAAWHAGTGRYTVAPALTLMTVAAAHDRAVSEGLDTNVAGQQYSETVPAGTVISAEPGAGRQIRKDGAIDLVVSRGPERHTVPDLRGRTKNAAESELATLTLVSGTIKQQYSEVAAAGTVIAQSVAPGNPVKHATPVGLVISQGRRPITVPVVTGTTQAKATASLSTAGLSTTVRTAYSDTVAKGNVISQQPTSGTLHLRDTVTLTVSMGPEFVAVPNVIRKSVQDASAVLKAAGFEVQLTHAPYFVNAGLVVAQTPTGKARPGTTIQLMLV